MRPNRDDIAGPAFPGRIRWLNRESPPVLAELTAAGPVLVHFFDFAQLNSVRALPYVLAWHDRYAELGLTVLGVHSPRFRFTGERAALDAGIAELGVEHPVADDSGYAIWHDYGCTGWPALFLWGRSGALRWAHFGEGEYEATELAIQEALGPSARVPPGGLPEPLAPVRPTDAAGALVAPPSPELFPGGSPGTPWEAEIRGEEIALTYEAGGAWVVADGSGELRIAIDGGAPAVVPIGARGLHLAAEHPAHERHELVVATDPGARIWAVSFAAGMPAGESAEGAADN